MTCGRGHGRPNCLPMDRFEETVKKALAKRLKQARKDAGFRFANDFARALGKEEHTYRAWERGEHMPDVATLTRICKLLNIEPNDLLPLALKKSHVKAPTEAGRSAA
jgi:transcriptional regulator with XRE-family HTH domain